MRNGDKFIFTAASIDAGTSITLGAKITGDASGAADGAYMSDISFSSTLINPLLAGDIYTFGSFLSGDVNLVSLDWRVLSVDEANNRALLVTEQAVTKMAYQTAGNSYNWSTSDVKTWLNGTGDNQFLKGFSTEEKARILKVSITDGTEGQNKNSSTIIAPNQSADGLDSVFLLSVADVGGYFSNNGYNDDDRKCTLLTDSSVCKWWLRSPGKDDNTRVAQIDDDGVVDDDGSFVTNIIGVRPAVWIKLK
ncbi:MAG: hypothetical protein IJ597_06435 [Synergistaceae bacterium]|nr:hypothetical protein [Synergistaceae bacterium]